MIFEIKKIFVSVIIALMIVSTDMAASQESSPEQTTPVYFVENITSE